MELTKKELSIVILGMEALMEQLKDDGIRDTLFFDEYRKDFDINLERCYDAWEIADKATAELKNKSKQLQK